MLWIKALHIVFVASWFACLFYLPRLFINLVQVSADSHAERGRLLVMGRKLYRFGGLLMLPALVLGAWLWLGYGIGRGADSLWLHLKLALVVCAMGYHHACGRLLRAFENFKNRRTELWLRLFNESAVLLFTAIVVLVVVKPFNQTRRMSRDRSLAVPLTASYGALVVYASLYPLTGWHHPQGIFSLAFLNIPWPHWWTPFDVVANLLGYIPLGALVFSATVRSTGNSVTAIVWALALPSVLSLTMESLQNYLPQRVPSALDWLANASGAMLGGLLAAFAHWCGVTLRWQVARDRWFVPRSAAALTLLLLWPVGLLFPTPVALGVGQVLPQLQAAVATLSGWLQSVPWAPEWVTTLTQVETATPRPPFSEGAIITLGLLAPCMLSFTIAREGWRRWVLTLAMACLGFVATTLSTAMNFGPPHALAWITPAAAPAFAAATALATLLAGASHRATAALGLIVTTGLVVLVAQAPSDPYFAESLQAWEQGRFIRFHGVAQWVGWLWPYVLLAHLLQRVITHDRD